MIVTEVMTMTNNKKQRTMNYPKQSQTKPILEGEGGGIFEQFSCEVQKLSSISAVGDFVVNGEGHIHRLSRNNTAVVRDAGIGYPADAEDTALAGDNYRNKGVYS